MIVSVLGIIGAGKSTLAEALAQYTNSTLYSEPVKENPFLVDFYADQKRWGLTMQLFLLHHRFKQHSQMMHSPIDSVSDSSIFADYCFASMLYESNTITSAEYKLYLSALENMKLHISYPDVIIYIDCEPKKAIQRIEKRNRGCECGIPESYLADLHKQYEIMLKRLSQYVAVIRIKPFETTEEMTDYLIPLAATIKEISEGKGQWDKVVHDWKL